MLKYTAQSVVELRSSLFGQSFSGVLLTRTLFFVTGTLKNMSADTKIAELLTELHQLIKQTQVRTDTGLWWFHGDEEGTRI